jgi:type VII secretion-associated serine protease mycosin
MLASGVAGASAQSVGQKVRADDLAALRAINVPAAWRTAKGRGVTVAVLDTGANPKVPDLIGSVKQGPDYAAGADPASYHPPHLHGTYISSIIAGHGSGPGRAEGMIGVAPQAKILSIRVILDDQEPGFFVYNENANYYDAIANGIRYAVRHGAQVINMSLGSTVATRNIRQAVGYAIAHDVVVVASAGNDGERGHRFTPYSYPASFTGVISVAAVRTSGKRASFSDRNASVVVAAPGVRVAGEAGDGSYVIGDGTSPASAFVAGVAALIRSRYPRLNPAQVMQAIVSSTRRRPAGGYNPGVGFGEVDAAAALVKAGHMSATQARTVGMAASQHFGNGASGPIAVIHRNKGEIAGLTGVAAVAALAFLWTLVALTRRRRRRRQYQPSWPLTPPAAPPGPPPDLVGQ